MITSVPALQRGLDLLELLSLRPEGLSFGAIRGETRIPLASLTRLLRVLARRGYLRTDGAGGYRLGLRLFAVGASAVHAGGLSAAAREPLERLVLKTGETAELCALEGLELVFLDRRESPRPIALRATVGFRAPVLHIVAAGKVSMAFVPGLLDRYLRERRLIRATKHTITDPRTLMREIEAIRKAGFGWDFEEGREEVCRVAAPILDARGAFAGTIGVAGPAYRMPRSSRVRLGRFAVKAGRAVTEAIGGAGINGVKFPDRRLVPQTHTDSHGKKGKIGEE